MLIKLETAATLLCIHTQHSSTTGAVRSPRGRWERRICAFLWGLRGWDEEEPSQSVGAGAYGREQPVNPSCAEASQGLAFSNLCSSPAGDVRLLTCSTRAWAATHSAGFTTILKGCCCNCKARSWKMSMKKLLHFATCIWIFLSSLHTQRMISSLNTTTTAFPHSSPCIRDVQLI